MYAPAVISPTPTMVTQNRYFCIVILLVTDSPNGLLRNVSAYFDLRTG
jgi:hypothetical protein